ncbi:MAG TPA: efflux transporter outer membrane subunit [Povalibacter sp.]|nr:efflux transporter outer membrane subunit [Povalibacter sp.]
MTDSYQIRWAVRAGVLALTIGLTACAVGPDYRPPQPPTPDQWHSEPQTGMRTDDSAELLASWWTVLNDPILNQLIEQARADNKSVKQALARVTAARARRGIAGAGFWPGVSASAGVTRSDTKDVPGATRLYDAGIDAGWELDLFGGQRRSFESATAQLGASEADLQDVLITLLGDVALNYVNLRTTQSRLTYAERNLESQREVVDITNWRAQAGLATELDLEQARSSYATTLAAIPQLQSNLEAAKNRLAVLTGKTPGTLEALLAERKPIPVAPADIVSSVPAEVLRRRPDIRAAERRLAAQTAQVGVATAQLFPSLSLSGSLGVTAGSAGDLLSDGVKSNRYGLSINMPIFEAGALLQNVKVQRAGVDEALATYEATVLAAYEEVENALTEWINEQQRHAALIDAASSARAASELALNQYNAGLVDFQTVLTADRQLISSEDALAVSNGEMTSNLIRLYKAFGGGWSVFPAPIAAATGP